MEIFNIGLPELLFIALIMIIVLGPDQSVSYMKSLARFVRKLVRSPLWAEILNTSREIKDLPTKMMRETGLEDDLAEMNRQMRSPSGRSDAPSPQKMDQGAESQGSVVSPSDQTFTEENPKEEPKTPPPSAPLPPHG
jgi:Sec-independent protein translocase protein TatA